MDVDPAPSTKAMIKKRIVQEIIIQSDNSSIPDMTVTELYSSPGVLKDPQRGKILVVDDEKYN
jgi:hypothetical protein